MFFFLEDLQVHLFCFSFHVEECIVEECIVVECIVGEYVLVFTPNTCVNKDIQLHQYKTRVFNFWPQLLL